MSKLLLPFLLLIACSCTSTDQKENIVPRTYTCQSTNCNISIDGYLNEKDWKLAKWSEPFVDIQGEGLPKPAYSTQMKMLWDTTYLYVAAKLDEPHLWATLANRDDIIYRDNDFELFIDPDGDGLNYYEFEINALGTEFDLFMNKPYNKKGKADIPWDFKGLVSAVSLLGSLNDPTDTDQSWTVEVAIPWTAFSENDQHPPGAGDHWRMNFSRVQWELEVENNKYSKKKDDNGEFLAESNWVWSPQGVINMHIPEKWGIVEFVNSAGEDALCNDSPQFWVWTSENKNRSNAYWDSTFSKLRNMGIEAVLMNANPDILSHAIQTANNYNIEVHAWFWTMNRGDADTSWLSVNRLGNSLAHQKAYVDYYKFMCPALPEVRQFLKTKIDLLMQVQGLMGIHMDYIRYVDAILPIGLQPKYGLVQDHIFPEFDYGYHPQMRRMYKSKYGIDPLRMENPNENADWLNFRLSILDTTVWGIRNQIRNKDMIISAAVFPTPEMSKKMVRQGWNNWELDYYFPMVYHNFYNESFDWIETVISTDRAALNNYSKLFCGLYVPGLKNEKDLTKAMDAAMKGGADGIAFFDLRAIGEEQQQQITDFIAKQKK